MFEMNMREPLIFERIYGHLKKYDVRKGTFLFLVIIETSNVDNTSTCVDKMRSTHQKNHNRSR